MRLELRRQRLRRGWSQERAATELIELATRLELPRLGVDGNAVGRWERGVNKPGPYYVALLCQLYGQTAEELDLVDEIMDPVRRREFLSGMVGVGGLLLAGQQPVKDAELRCLEELQQMTEQFGSWYWRLSPSSLLPALAGHQNRLLTALDAAPGASSRALAALTAQNTMIFGLASYRDGDTATAGQRLMAAEQLAQLAGDQASEAMALIARGGIMGGPKIEVGAREHALAHQLLELAYTTAGAAAAPLTLVWLYVSRAEEAAALGRPVEALSDLDRAHRALARAGRGDRIGFFDHWDELRLEGWRASVLLLLNRPADASRVLEPVVAGTPPRLPGPRAAVLADLASALAQAGEPERSCSLLEEALLTARTSGVQDGVHRVRCIRERQLDRWATIPAVRQLDNALVG